MIGYSSIPHLLPTSNADGLISVFDIAGKVKRINSFYVTQFDSHILEKFTQDFIQSGIWSGTDTSEYIQFIEDRIINFCQSLLENCPVSKNITALSIVSEKQNTNISKSPRPTIICGLSVSCQPDKATLKSSNETERKKLITQLYLVVYDFMYTKEQEDAENNAPLNPNPPCNHEDNLNMYSTNLYDDLESNDFETEDVSGYNLMKQLSSYYKNFIPGECDEVFLPPTMVLKKTHTGPKVLHDAYDSKKSTFTSNSYPLTSNQNSSEHNDVSISDHILEVSEKSIQFFIEQLAKRFLCNIHLVQLPNMFYENLVPT